MDKAEWVMSEGGPLICMEGRWASTWGGIDRLTVANDGASHDYDRACRSTRYIETIPLARGSGLVLGDAPLDTAVWQSPAGTTFLVRIWYCEPDFDVDATMRGLDPRVFDTPEESLPFLLTSGELILFDSADLGDNPRKTSISFTMSPGAYTILTKPYEPSADASLILHRFDPTWCP